MSLDVLIKNARICDGTILSRSAAKAKNLALRATEREILRPAASE